MGSGKEIAGAALMLSQEGRVELVFTLAESLDHTIAPEANKAWSEEAARRKAKIEAGEAILADADEVVESVRAALRNPR